MLYAPGENQALPEVLDFISKQTSLNFQQLSAELVVIIQPTAPKQVICGFIRNDETNELLVGATISSSSESTITNSMGFFSFDNSDSITSLTVQFLGFETLSLPITDFSDGCLDISLKPSVAALPEVVILNYVARGIDRTLDGSLTVRPKNQQLLPGMTEPDVLFTIQALPGIQSTDETVSNINIRGGTHDQNLILWEGIRMYQSGHFFGLISAFNPHFNDKVKIIKNGTSAQFGNGTSGTIDMRSDDQLELQKVSGSAGIGLNMINGDLNLRIPLSEKTNLKVSSRRAITDIIRTPTFDRYFDRAFENTEILNPNPSGNVINTDDKFYFYDVGSRLTHRFSGKSKLALSFIAISNNLDFEETEIAATPNSRTSTLSQNSIAGGLDYEKFWTSNFSTSLQSSASRYGLDAVNFDIPNDQRLIQENQVTDYNLQFAGKIKSDNAIIQLGYEWDETGIQNLEDINNPDFRRLTKDVMTTHSGFVESSMGFGKTNLRFGVRGNFYSQLDELVIEPRVAISNQLSEQFSIEVLGEIKSQATAQVIDLQTDFLGVEKRRWVLSDNVTIPLIKSQNVSVGAHYKKNGLLISAEGYYREVDGIITSSQGFLNQFELIREQGSYNVIGVEVLLNYAFSDFTTWVSWTHTSNEYDFPELSTPTFPNNLDVRSTITSGVSYEKGPFSLSLGVISRTGKPFTSTNSDSPIVNGEINYAAPNEVRLKDYFRMDFSADYRFDISKKTRGHLGLSFWNITNNENLLNQFYQLDNQEVLQLNQRALEMTPNVIFRVTF